MIRHLSLRHYLLRTTLTMLLVLSVAVLIGCAKFNPILGSADGSLAKDDPRELFIPDDGSEDSISEIDNGYSGDNVTPPIADGQDSNADTENGRLY